MIPHRIALAGFLSYQDEQEVIFDGSPLWMLSGRNGSGKSSIFDGFTFALFGHHRGGSQQVQELINKDSNNLAVEFDFSIDKNKYRIRRTVKRTTRGGAASTQQIYRSEAVPNSTEPAWVPVADTNRRVEFDNWVGDKIGLTYETFTSSVLLLQGQAEKLLDAAPKGRAEVLASIVDLGRYQRLHERAVVKRRGLENDLEQIDGKLNVIPEISEEQIRQAEDRLRDAEQQRAGARGEIERCQQLRFDAQKWEELQGRVERLREQWQQANQLLGDAGKIEAHYARLSELREVLPHVTAIQQFRVEIEASENRTRKLLHERRQIQNRRDERAHELDLAHKKRSALQAQQTQDEQRRQQIESRLRELTGVLERLRLFEEEQVRLADQENQLQRLPPNPRQTVSDIQGILERAQEKAMALPSLERFEANRSELRQKSQRLAELTKQQKTLRKQGEEAKKRLEKATADLEAAIKSRETADARATEARTLFQQAKNELKELDKLKGKGTCSHCGQKLTAGHLQEERKRREMAQQQTKEAEAEAAQAQTEAKKIEAQCETAAKQAEEALQKLRDQYRDVDRESEQVKRDIERCRSECLKAFEALPKVFRERIAPTVPEDWLETKYPEAADLKNLQREAAEAETHRANLRKAEETCRQWERLHNQAESCRQTIARLRQELPAGDPAAIRGDHARVQAEETALKNRLAGSKKSLAENQNDVDRFVKEIAQIDKQLAEIDGSLKAEEVQRTNLEDSIDRARRQLPEKWQELARQTGLSEQHQWNIELRELEEAKVVERYQQLAQARMGLEGMRQDAAGAEAQMAAFPQEARISVAEAELRLQEAKRLESEREKLLRAVEREKGLLEQHRDERARLSREKLDKEREKNYFDLLVKLLGRDRLQRHLVRMAERQIVDYANAVLDRLSAGQLLLKLGSSDEGTPAERALELEAHNRVTGDAPINVAFLSGSQRFRVAVSLALGIGQYASRQHRPIESVIIDEGFGCLDREGRQVMIQELQNLRGQLRCILLVSHQEEFADAFPDGYRFELEEGATRVTRVQR